MPSNIDLSALTPPTLLAQNPLGATRTDMRDGSRGGTSVPPSELFFSEDFQGQADWNSGQSINDLDDDGLPDRIQSVRYGHTMPDGVYAVYQAPDWSPSLGHPDRAEAISILTPAEGIAMPGYTKVLQHTRDSQSNIWNSDSSTMWLLDDGVGNDELYVEAWIKFDEDWTSDQNASDKLFRLTCWNMQEPIFRYFSDGTHGPMVLWLWNRTSFGVRMFLAFRGGPYSDNYAFDESRIENVNFINGSLGDLTLPWTTGRVGQGPDGTTAQLPDLVNGGYLPTSGSQIITHPQLFGSQWNKVAFYVKMQSAVNVADGQFAFWLNDKRVFVRKQINWCPTGINGTSALPNWNALELGGNDNFTAYPDADRRQEYYYWQKVTAYRHRQPWAEWDTE